MPRIGPVPGATAVVAVVAAVMAAVAMAGPPRTNEAPVRHEPDPRSLLWEPKQAFFERRMELEALPPDATRASQDEYDVEYYDIDITVDVGAESIEGVVTIRAVSLIECLRNSYLYNRD